MKEFIQAIDDFDATALRKAMRTEEGRRAAGASVRQWDGRSAIGQILATGASDDFAFATEAAGALRAHLSDEALDRAVFAAAKLGAPADLVKRILPSGRLKTRGEGGESALFMAACVGSAALVDLLLPLSDPEAKTSDGLTALMAAAARDDALALAALLPHCDANAVSAGGQTALMVAAGNGAPECVAKLLQASNPDAIDSLGRTALHYAVGQKSDDFLTSSLSSGEISRIVRQGGFAALSSPGLLSRVLSDNPAAKKTKLLAPKTRAAQDPVQGAALFQEAVSKNNFRAADYLSELAAENDLRAAVERATAEGLEGAMPVAKARIERFDLVSAARPDLSRRPKTSHASGTTGIAPSSRRNRV
jgi:ankyrin repeat protein